jgi:hypothetical protein
MMLGSGADGFRRLEESTFYFQGYTTPRRYSSSALNIEALF